MYMLATFRLLCLQAFLHDLALILDKFPRFFQYIPLGLLANAHYLKV